MMEEEFLALVKYLKQIEFKINLLYLICEKGYSKKWNDRKELSKIYKLLFSYLLSLHSRLLAFMLHSFFKNQ